MIKGAIVGFGGAARRGHWPAYAASTEVSIVAIVDRTPERRAVAAALSDGLPTFPSLAALRASGIAIDFVDICTPPAFHVAPVREAIAAGWHVLCEKPLFLAPADVDDVRRQAVRAGVAVVPVHNWKYAPIVRHASAALEAGRIGALRSIEIETRRVKDCAAVDPMRPNWRRDPAVSGGGIVMDHGWHAVYLAISWFRQAPGDVNAILGRPSPDSVEDEASVFVMFPSGRATIRLTWNAETRRNTARLGGERGEIVVDDGVLSIADAHGVEQISFDRPLSSGSHHDDWFAAMLPDVIAAFRDPERSRPAFEEAAACLSVIRQAYEADRAAAAGPGDIVETA